MSSCIICLLIFIHSTRCMDSETSNQRGTRSNAVAERGKPYRGKALTIPFQSQLPGARSTIIELAKLGQFESTMRKCLICLSPAS